eukprot:TRINITY_DN1351_c0_g1_i1.p2 TRINITY_DN1351_c0_g1~~TRINITY_DN1351_c0_g1_i1.p2  ORF type:complete len:175 (+),score=24.18 TRINITY_DN1351_c0_g1_i1:262-786(+)
MMSLNKAAIFFFIVIGSLLLFGARPSHALCESMATGTDSWSCAACGDSFPECNSNDIPLVDQCWTNTVPGCTFDQPAEQWFCCRNCILLFAQDVCYFDGTGSGSWSTSGTGSEHYHRPMSTILISCLVTFGILAVVAIVLFIIRRRRLAHHHHHHQQEYIVVQQQVPAPNYGAV